LYIFYLNLASPYDEKVLDLKFFIYYSEFLPCILKSLNFLSSSLNEPNDELYDELITNILNLLSFFINENMQNSKLFISDSLFYYIKEIPFKFSKKVFELIYIAISNISKFSNELYNTKSIIKRIHSYYKKILVIKYYKNLLNL
jgi:hypothetical protein